MENIKKIIGRDNSGRYRYLKGLAELTDKQQQFVKEYESKQNNHAKNQEYYKKVDEVAEQMRNPNKNKVQSVDASTLYRLFIKQFLIIEKKSFIADSQSIENLKPVIYYFARDNRFFECKNVMTVLNFEDRKKESTPSFDKGLLLIGNFGVGKTVFMRVLKSLFKVKSGFSFKSDNANDIVEKFESCEDAKQKKGFWSEMNRGILYIDDAKTEREASNYGKSNLLKDLIEKRYNKDLKTHLSCNFKEGCPNDIEAAVHEFGEKYGSRVFDRLFEMFNIVVFQGSSFRGKKPQNESA